MERKTKFDILRLLIVGSGLETDEKKELVDFVTDYEEAEENGMLIHLPCRVGDTVWYVDSDDDSYPIELCVTKIEIFKNAIFYRAVTTDDGTTAAFFNDDIGKTVFHTREEAEQALAKIGE